ncbi:TonB-dependent receptor plug domain-containing protein, partial [Streptomyces europaeiscabiei]|uniref:TonB-dependent receptor plug domain-containing protein n=1 Tax=Streptomyces europaeiscabiei TaxID=146819 RepID=UPI0038F7182D
SPVDGFVATRSATGTKTDLPLIETPQTVNVITRDQIDVQAAQTIGDALRYTAGVTKVQGFNRTDDAVNIRGFQSSASNLFRDGTRQQYN